MSAPVARDHHYVPRFLLKPWAKDGSLSGYYWDSTRRELRVNRRGVGAFCKELDLLSLKAAGLRPDVLENEFFGTVDDRGAKVRQALLHDPQALSADERADFARLLLSLDARRPNIVAKLKTDGAAHLRDSVDLDSEVTAAMQAQGIVAEPSDYYEEEMGHTFEDRALLMIQALVDNETVGCHLINAHWRVYRLDSADGTFVLPDRPLIRTAAYNNPRCVWSLPLSPKEVFIAANAKSVIQGFDRADEKELRKRVNKFAVNQADRYIFTVDEGNLPLMRKRLSAR